MKEFDIKSVKFKAPEQEELLTGEYVKGLDPASDITSNSETEKGEYVQFPDNTTQEIKGETHEDGGVKMHLPDGSKILSNNLTLTKKDVKMLREEYDVKASTSDTFATALNKYVKKIGLEKLYEEQEELFSTLKEQLDDKSIEEGTLKVNKEYISKKIYDVEQQKLPKEKMKSDMFNTLFKEQEKQKKPEKSTEDSKFKYGGVSRASFDNLCKKHGMTPDEGIKMLEDGGILVPKYQDGATVGDEPKYTFSYTDNAYKPQKREKQTGKKDIGYGNVQTSQDALQELYNNFPDIVVNNFSSFVAIDDKGKVTFKGGIDLGTKQAVVGKMQKDINDRMTSTAMSVYNDETLPEEDRKKAKDWLENEQFTYNVDKSAPLEDRVRAYDEKLGQFTAGRTLLAVDLVTPEDLIKLNEKGIRTFNQITPEVLGTLSDESKQRYEKFKPKVKENADFFLNQYNINKPEEPKVEEIKDNSNEPGAITQKAQLPNKKYPTMFFTPDQSVLPPNPQQAETMATNRFQRIDPIRIGIEDTLRQLSDSRQFVSDQMDSLPPTQRAAAMSSILAQTQAAENEAFLKTNQTNAQYQSQAELFNIGQAEKEDVSRTNNLLNYEARALTGAAKTEEDFRNYFDFNRKVALNNYNTQRNLNLLNSLFPDYQLNFTGTQVDYDPSSEFKLENRDKVIATMGNIYNQGQ